jgi:hypothetical protein
MGRSAGRVWAVGLTPDEYEKDELLLVIIPAP